MRNWVTAITPWILLGTLAMAQGKYAEMPIALEEVVSSERAFARMSVERGVRESFLHFFADTGIVFRPGPVPLKEDYGRRPAPSTPPPVTLNWAPIYGDVSGVGDLGYDTGPYLLEDRRPQGGPTQHGLFSSVWKKQAGGQWKVVLDVGVPTPGPVTPLETPFRAAPILRDRNFFPGRTPVERGEELLAREREFFQETTENGAGPAYREFLHTQARIHRSGLMPLVGEAARNAWLEGQSNRVAGEPMFAEVSISGDLGYTYGSYEITGDTTEKGHYARVWTRNSQGQWLIVLDVTNPLPVAD